MAANNVWSNPGGTVGNLNGLFKETYADKLKDLVPDGVKLLNKIDFVAKDKMPGNLYHQPVILGLEHGVTFASSDDDAFSLNAPISGSIKDAQIKGNPLLLRSVLGLSAASRSATSQQAFEQGTKYLVANMMRSMARKLEIEMLYGQVGYGAVGVTPTTTTISIAAGEWAPGIWAGAESMPIEIRDITGATVRGQFTVVSVDMSAKTVTVSASPVTAGVVATDIIWHTGAFGNEFAGLHKILSQTTGSLFNINVGTFNLFRGNIYDAQAAALSFTKLNSAVARAVEKGQDGKMLALVNPRTWANLNNDQAALRRYDSSYKSAQAEMGTESIKFHSQNGELEIEPSIFVKEGYSYLIGVDDFMRVGSTEMTFKRPGHEGDFFRDLDGAAGYELRLYTDQALFCSAPGRSVLITNIVTSA